MIYFDNSATTKMAPEALETYSQVVTKIWGNPSSLHKLGDRAQDRKSTRLNSSHP